MSSFSFGTVAVSVVLSSVASFCTVIALQRRSPSAPSPVVRTNKLQIVDSHGRVRGVFGLNEFDKADETPRLALLTSSGKQSLQLELDERGYGDLAFGSNRWAEGAVVVGHVGTGDTTGDAKTDLKDTNGAWGLQVRDRGDGSMMVGYRNSGEPLRTAGDCHPGGGGRN